MRYAYIPQVFLFFAAALAWPEARRLLSGAWSQVGVSLGNASSS